MRRVLTLAVVLASVLTVVSSAQAGWRIDRAERIAAIVWQHPCNDRVRVIWDTARQTTAFGTTDAAAWADIPGCAVHLTTNFWATPGDVLGWDWPVLCMTLLHEYGHLAGYRDPGNTSDPEHGHDPQSIMAANRTVAVIDDSYGRRFVTGEPRCNHRGRPFLLAHEAL